MFLHNEEIVISGYDHLGASFDSAFEDHIILWITRHTLQAPGDFREDGVVYVFANDCQNFFVLPGNFRMGMARTSETI